MKPTKAKRGKRKRVKADKLAHAIVEGILDAVERTGRIEHGRLIFSTLVSKDGKMSSVVDRLKEWTAEQLTKQVAR